MKIFLLTVALLLAASAAAGGPLIQSSLAVTTWGFPNSRDETDTGINSSLLADTAHFVHLNLKENRELAAGYLHSSVQQSQILTYMVFHRKKIDFESGVFFGFPNELPIEVTPGLYERVTVELGSILVLSVYGKTSLFLSPLLSLSPSESQIDQNLFGYSSAYQLEGADLVFAFEHLNMKQADSAGSITTNSRKRYEMSVITKREGSRINYATGIGGEAARFKTALTHQKLIGFYLSERVYWRIKNAVMDLGIKGYFLNLPLKDIEDASIPSYPIFSLSAGIELSL